MVCKAVLLIKGTIGHKEVLNESPRGPLKIVTRKQLSRQGQTSAQSGSFATWKHHECWILHCHTDIVVFKAAIELGSLDLQPNKVTCASFFPRSARTAACSSLLQAIVASAKAGASVVLHVPEDGEGLINPAFTYLLCQLQRQLLSPWLLLPSHCRLRASLRSSMQVGGIK